jgi:hypothetical protein
VIACPAFAGQAPLPQETRDAAGNLSLRAVQLKEPLRIDGNLDEALYRDVEPISNFIQIEPQEGKAATELTDLWIAFDDKNVYVSFRCFESEPGRVVAKELRRDGTAMWNGDDNVTFILDTFHDRRNGVQFTTNALGGKQDGQFTNERNWSGDWNPVWDVKTARTADAWTVEIAIPFKSLRYGPGTEQVWGFNAFRTNRWKNELSYLVPVPKERGQLGIQMASLAAPLSGIVAPSGAKNLDLKPYVTSNASRQRITRTTMKDDVSADFGVDAKYGITQNVTADVTYNTDFAQVEADQQQVNLTRFSLFFPEKRDFFLENAGTFAFGGLSASGSGAGDTPIMFYSRRIGLEQGQAVPIDAGGRVTGRIGRYNIGLIDIDTSDESTLNVPSTNFSVVRIKRDLLRRSSIGLLATGRREGAGGLGNNAAYGVDGTFSFFSNVNINTYWARTQAFGTSRADDSYRAQLDYAGDRYGAQLEHLKVGRDFNPGVGYVRRPDMVRNFAQLRFSPRPQRSRTVRKYSWIGGVSLIENGAGQLESREQSAEFDVDFQNADRFVAEYTGSYELLRAPFRIAPRVTLPVGGYDFDNMRLQFNRSGQHRVAGNLSVEYGTFYNGHRTAAGLSGGRVNFSSRVSAEPTYSINHVELVQGAFTTHLAGARLTWTQTPLMFTSALLQYNSSTHTTSANVRLRWEYRPGSELFVVYNEDRDALVRGFPDLTNRAFIVKVNRLLRF